jgi:prepilin-type N-terminal cleavage/methylation domain-containing protein
LINSKFRIQNSKLGFTLIEILVAIAVVLVVGGIIASVLTITLRGSNKATSLDIVRRNGNYAIEHVSRTIRYAKSFEGVSTGIISGSTELSPYASYTTNCVTSTITPTPPPVNYKYVKVEAFDGGMTVFSCIPYDPLVTGSTGEIASISANVSGDNISHLIDTDAVRVNSCKITCSQDNLFSPPTITFGFDLVKMGAGNFAENKAQVPFQTSITVRNY